MAGHRRCVDGLGDGPEDLHPILGQNQGGGVDPVRVRIAALDEVQKAFSIPCPNSWAEALVFVRSTGNSPEAGTRRNPSCAPKRMTLSRLHAPPTEPLPARKSFVVTATGASHNTSGTPPAMSSRFSLPPAKNAIDLLSGALRWTFLHPRSAMAPECFRYSTKTSQE